MPDYDDPDMYDPDPAWFDGGDEPYEADDLLAQTDELDGNGGAR